MIQQGDASLSANLELSWNELRTYTMKKSTND